MIPGVGAAFEVPTWEAVGQRLWEEISSGDKTAGRFSILWRLVRETLQETESERTVAASAFAALTPAMPSASGNATLLSNDAPNLFENRIRMPPLWAVKETTAAETRDGEIAERARTISVVKLECSKDNRVPAIWTVPKTEWEKTKRQCLRRLGKRQRCQQPSR